MVVAVYYVHTRQKRYILKPGEIPAHALCMCGLEFTPKGYAVIVSLD